MSHSTRCGQKLTVSIQVRKIGVHSLFDGIPQNRSSNFVHGNSHNNPSFLFIRDHHLWQQHQLKKEKNLKSYKNPLKPLNINMLFYTHFMEENVQLGNQLKWFIVDDHCLLKFPWTSLLKRKQILPGEMSCWSLITYSSYWLQRN